MFTDKIKFKRQIPKWKGEKDEKNCMKSAHEDDEENERKIYMHNKDLSVKTYKQINKCTRQR